MLVRKSLFHYSDPMECHVHRPCRPEDPGEYKIHGIYI